MLWSAGSLGSFQPGGDWPFREGKDILWPISEASLQLFCFDKAYLERLRDGEKATEQHFVSYFSRILGIMLHARYLSPERVDDIRQETLTRVVAILRRDGGIRQPERFGAFVNSICKNVLRESWRAWNRAEARQPEHQEVPNRIVDVERTLISEETAKKVREVLEEMKARDRDLLTAVFLEERSKDEICREFGVDRDYLRVLLHRAKERFRSGFRREQGLPDQTTRIIKVG